MKISLPKNKKMKVKTKIKRQSHCKLQTITILHFHYFGRSLPFTFTVKIDVDLYSIINGGKLQTFFFPAQMVGGQGEVDLHGQPSVWGVDLPQCVVDPARTGRLVLAVFIYLF